MDTNSSNFERLVCSNLSRESVGDAFRVSKSYQPYTISLVVTYMLYLLVGLPWNLLVIATILKQRLYLQPTIVLLLNLVVTDCVSLVLVVSVKVITGVAGEFVLGDSDHVRCEVCRAEQIIRNAVSLAAILTIAVIAFDRFFFIHKPLHYEKLISVKSSLVTVAVTWLLSILFVSLHVGLLRNVFMDELLLQCSWDISEHPYFHIFSILVIIVSYIFLLVCNVWVVAIVLRNIRSIYKIRKSYKGRAMKRVSLQMLSQQMKQTHKKKQLHLMRVFGGIIVANTLSSLPLAILAVFSFMPEHARTLVPAEYVIISTLLFNSQLVVHPILESTLIKEIRTPILKLLSCACCWNKNEASFSSSRSGDSNAAMDCCPCCQGENAMACCAMFKLALVSHVDDTPPGENGQHIPATNFTPIEPNSPNTACQNALPPHET